MSKAPPIEPSTIRLPEDNTTRHAQTWRDAQQLDLDAAILAADRGEFASADEASEFFARHTLTI